MYMYNNIYIMLGMILVQSSQIVVLVKFLDFYIYFIWYKMVSIVVMVLNQVLYFSEYVFLYSVKFKERDRFYILKGLESVIL